MSMKTEWSFGKIDMGVAETTEDARPDRDTPFRILLLGDFSGRGSRGIADAPGLARRRPVAIDRDNVDEVFARLGVEVGLPVGEGGTRANVRFGELDELHPDHIVDQLAVFGELRVLRRRLLNADTFDDAAATLAGWAGAETAAQTPAEPESPSAPEAPEPGVPMPDDLFDTIIAETTEQSPDEASRSGSDLADRLIREIVGPYVVPAPVPRQGELVASVDTATGHQLRTILHDPDFQSVEGGWRALDLLVRRLETDARLKLYLIDVTRDELAADLAADELAKTGLYKLLVGQTIETPGGQPWAAVMGHFSFGGTAEDAALLGRIARIAARAGAPFLAAADSALVGCRSLAAAPDSDDWTDTLPAEAGEAWQALRGLPEATYLGLYLPRFLLRFPYGKRTDPVRSFDFEEITDDMDDAARHAAYLWGNPAFAAICLVGQAFSEAGWDLRPGAPNQLEGMPLHVFTRDGDQELLPCAEILLTERGAERLLERGITPVWTVKDTDRIRVGPFRPLAAGARKLAGRWAS